MDRIKKEEKTSTLRTIDRYVFGVALLLFGAAGISVTNYISGLFFILAAIVILKPTMSYVEKKINSSLSQVANFFVIFCLIIATLAAVPHVTPEIDSNGAASFDPIGTQPATEFENKFYISNFDRGYYRCSSWSSEQFPVIELFGENYVPFLENGENIWNSQVNKLAKLVTNSGDNYSIRPGETLDLGEGYSLKAKQIDFDNQKVWLEFRHNGEYVDDNIISISNVNDATWNIELHDIQGTNNIVVFKVHINQFYFSSDGSIAQIDGIWLIDYADARTLETGDVFGNYTLKEINSGVDESSLGSLAFEQIDTQNNE